MVFVLTKHSLYQSLPVHHSDRMISDIAEAEHCVMPSLVALTLQQTGDVHSREQV